jgi:hypothetical protein
MIAFLKELWLAEHAHVDLRGHLIRIFRLMLAIPTAERFYTSKEVNEELLSGQRDVPTKSVRIISATKQHEVVELQERFKPLIVEQVEVVIDYRIEKLVSCEHVLPHRVSKVITTGTECRIDCREMTLHIAQLILNASKMQAQPFPHRLQQ